ncbi:hypothetical protein, partial [Parafrankia sp. EUN1f]
LAAVVPAAIAWARRTRANRRDIRTIRDVVPDIRAVRDVVCGTAEDKIRGHRRVPGVAERLDTLEQAVAPLSDRLQALEQAVAPLTGLDARVTRIEGELAAHLHTHGTHP